MRWWLSLVLLVVAAHSGTAQARDPIDLLDDDEDVLRDAPSEPTAPAPSSDLPTLTTPAEGDLLGETPEEAASSADNATIYRDTMERVRDLEPDEEIAAWERYLLRYPSTAFRERIEERIDKLMDALYSERIVPQGRGETVDALLAELPFSQALLLENINPRTRLGVGFEWGFPTWLNLYASYEHALMRNFSVQGGIRHRYTGWSAEAGVRYSPIKSLRTQTLVTFLGDFRFNMIPAFAAFRPQVAFGQIVADVVHVQAQFGLDMEFRNPVGVHLVGGANVTWLASDAVALFLEGQMDLKNVTWKEGGVFAFNTVTFGLKFFPKVANTKPRSLEANVGASLPVGTNYWAHHYGSVMGQANYYFPSK